MFVFGAPTGALKERKNMEVIIKGSDKSREYDMGTLEKLKSEGNKRAGEVLDRVYTQTKDETLSQGRRELIEAHKRGDVDRANRIEDSIRDYTKKNYGE